MNRCTWCKIGLALLLAALAALIAGLTISTGGAAGTAVVGAFASADVTITAAAGALIAKILVTIVGAGLGAIAVAILGDLICCKWFGVAACCVRDSIEFWLELSRRLEATQPSEDSEPGTLSSQDCEELEAIIRRLLAEEKIDADTAATLREALRRHCPG
jgi:hypothetical protein